jgi:hypothetical protein
MAIDNLWTMRHPSAHIICKRLWQTIVATFIEQALGHE